MGLIACTCPHCGGTVNMDDSMISGFCTYCGKQIINDKAVVGNVKVTMDRSNEVVNTLKLTKYSMYDGDANAARVLLDKALMMNSENSDVWYMDAVIDRKNAASDIARAKMYPSFGIFTEDEVAVYKNFDSESRNSVILIFAFMAAFMALFAVIPVAIIFEKYLLIPLVLAIGVVVCIAAFFYLKKKKPKIPAPVFKDENKRARQAAEDLIPDTRFDENV